MKKLKHLVSIVALVMGLVALTTTVAESNGLAKGNADFSSTVAEEEGYWYSRYNLGNLVMRSGLGDTFMPDMKVIKGMVKMADANPNDGDRAVPPKNPALLKSVFASGDPHYITKFNPADYATQRWDPSTFDTRVTTSAVGWTIIKETEWGKQFHVDEHFGTVTDNFGAQWRFAGLVLVAEAKMQASHILMNFVKDNGLVSDSDGNINFEGQWIFLEALSDLGNTLSLSKVPHSTTNRYRDPKGAMMFLGSADKLFSALSKRDPATIKELSLAIQSLVWYAAATNDRQKKDAAVKLIRKYGDILVEYPQNLIAQEAYAIRGLIEAYRVTKDRKYLNKAANTFESMSSAYRNDEGIFWGKSRYTIDDVAIILGSLNSLKLFAGDSVNQSRVEQIFSGFFESAVDMSGLQQSAPPKGIAKGKFEQYHPDNYYAYPGMPVPPRAGGKYGIAPVFASEIQWDSGEWKVVNRRFDPAGAMHASNEFIWFHNDEVNGFPGVK